MSSLDPTPIDVRQLARHHERLRRMVRALVGDEHRAEDVVQDAWVRALERRPDEPRSAGAWLKTVTRRLASNERRSRRRRNERERDVARPEPLPSSDEIAERVEIEGRVLGVLDSLDEPHRTVLRDRYLGELTPTELARRDGVSLNTVKSRLSRARAAMRAELESRGLGGDVHWSVAAAPLLVPRGPWAALDLPAATLPIPAATATSSLAGAAAIGGALAMKKALVLAAVVILGAVAWRLTSTAPDGLQPPSAAEPAASGELDPELVSLDKEGVVAGGARVAIEESSGALPADSEGAPGAWRIVGRAREARGNPGVKGLSFDLALYAGYDAGGELLAEERVVSGNDGRFELALENPGRTVTLTVESEHQEGFEVVTYGPYVVVAGDAPPELDALVFRIDGRLEGTVRDGAGNLVEGCTVEGHYGVAVTDLKGRYTMPIATGAWGEITARAPGYSGDSSRLEGLGAGAAVTLDFTLGEAVRIEGIVRAAGGAAIAGAHIECSGRLQTHAMTDAAGRYVIDSVAYMPGERVWVGVRADGFGPTNQTLELEVDRREYEQDFDLVRGVSVAGQLTDADGAPVAGAEVWFGRHDHAWGNSKTSSDDDGRFEFEGVAPGQMNVGAQKDGFPPATAAVTVPESGGGEDIALQFPRSLSVRGVVCGAQGKPIPGVAVAARQSFSYVGTNGRSDKNGEFELTGLPDGELTLEAYARGYVRAKVRVTSAGSGTPVVIEMADAGRITGRVFDAATGEPLNKFTVRFVFPTDPDLQPTVSGYNSKWSQPGLTFQDDGGRWSTGEYDELQVGAWIGVEVRAEGYSPGIEMVQVSAMDARLNLAHQLVRPVTVELVASLQGSGEPVAGATILATTRAHPSEEDIRWDATTGEAGTAVLEDVSPGSLFVIVTRAAGAPVRLGPFEVPPVPSRSILAIEVPAAHVVEVTLLDPSGQPLPGRTVVLTGSLQGSADVALEGLTDQDGVCRIEGVPAGRWDVSRVLQDGLHTCHDLTGHVTVQEGEPVARIELRPPGATVIRGTVDADGPIPPGCKVSALSRNGALNHGAVVHEGSFELAGLAPGRYMVTLSYWDANSSSTVMGHAEVEVHEGDIELDVTVKVKPM